ncbi:Ig-like domain-containing protein, partial [Paenibacillus physcomitrellae]
MDNDKHNQAGRPLLISVDSFTGKRVRFTVQIGGTIEPTNYEVYNSPKFKADYRFSTDIYWRALAETTKEISLSNGGQLATGATKQLNAAVRTQTGDGNFGPETNVNTGSGGQTTWTSSNPAVAAVSPSGMVSAAGKGTTTITVLWVKDGFQLTTSTTVTVGEDPGNGGNPPGGGEPIGSCTYTVSSPARGTVSSGSALEPNASGVLKADSRGTEQFDVLRGIPTSESLYA